MNKPSIPVLLILSSLVSAGCVKHRLPAETVTGITPPPVTAEFHRITVNGVGLQILERTTDRDNPVFLYLHGGPGHSIIPWAHAATGKLTADFTVVHYDQRGTGLSLDMDADPDLNTMEQFIDDCLDVTLYLKEKYRQEKIFLLGHSWGSVLGMRMIARYPEHYAGYIGVGQIVHWDRQVDCSRAWLRERILESNGSGEALSAAGTGYFFGPCQELLRQYGGIIHSMTWDEAGQISAASPWSPESYTGDLFRRGLSFSHSGGNLLRSYTEADFFTEIPEVRVPVAFFCGRYDYLTAAPVAARYLTGLKSPRTVLYWFEKSAHRCDIEEPELFQQRIREFFLPDKGI
jgi:pimeloyl-ACP methyl ester carboxylesterase